VTRISKIISGDYLSDFKSKSLQWSGQFDEVVYLDSNTEEQVTKQPYRSFDALLAVGAQKSVKTGYLNAFDKLKAFQNDTKDYLVGYLGYDLKNDTEALTSTNQDYLGFPDLFFFQPKKIFLFKDQSMEMLYLEPYQSEMEKDLQKIQQTQIMPAVTSPAPRISSRIDKKTYGQKVSNILEHIHRGDIYEVNFCQEFYAENIWLDPLDVYHKLNSISLAPFSCFLKLEDKYMMSASPERFVKKQDDHIIVQPIKGTARRIEDEQEDLLLADNLTNDPKERAENIMIVDLLRNDLSKHAMKGSVIVEELCKVYSFKQVHQLISTITCRTAQSVHPVDILKDLFPMGSMTGAPKISAMKIIEEEEETKRGLFSGAVGYITPSGDFDFNVVIRSIFYNETSHYASFSVGSAITSLSEIEKEYEECLLKAKALKKSLGASL
jgi:para-aminobenzoate synthetase component 1